MLRRILGWLSSTSSDKVDSNETQPRRQDDRDSDKGLLTSEYESNAGIETDEDSDELDDAYDDSLPTPFGEESDWDEYGDEIASAVAFASWQEAATGEEDWEEDDEGLAAELEEFQGSVDRWEDWAAVDEIEDDESYQWSESEEEEY